MDQDGDDDLYVANDFGPNHLYRNDAGVFTDVAAQTGAEDVNFGMSVAFGDFDRDAHEDIYVSNMFSAAGGRITFQPRFQPDADASMRRTYQQMARGNTLLRNRGDGLLTIAVSPQESPWVGGPGLRCLPTSTTMVGKTWSLPMDSSPANSRMTCEASSGGRSCRKHRGRPRPAPILLRCRRFNGPSPNEAA